MANFERRIQTLILNHHVMADVFRGPIELINKTIVRKVAQNALQHGFWGSLPLTMKVLIPELSIKLVFRLSSSQLIRKKNAEQLIVTYEYRRYEKTNP